MRSKKNIHWFQSRHRLVGPAHLFLLLRTFAFFNTRFVSGGAGASVLLPISAPFASLSTEETPFAYALMGLINVCQSDHTHKSFDKLLSRAMHTALRVAPTPSLVQAVAAYGWNGLLFVGAHEHRDALAEMFSSMLNQGGSSGFSQTARRNDSYLCVRCKVDDGTATSQSPRSPSVQGSDDERSHLSRMRCGAIFVDVHSAFSLIFLPPFADSPRSPYLLSSGHEGVHDRVTPVGAVLILCCCYQRDPYSNSNLDFLGQGLEHPCRVTLECGFDPANHSAGHRPFNRKRCLTG